MNIDIEELLKHIFLDIEFPYICVDVFKLLEAIETKELPSSYVGISLTEDEEKKKAIRGAFRGIHRYRTYEIS
jgi:hypothetical protein